MNDIDDGSIDYGEMDRSSSAKQLEEGLLPRDKEFKEIVLRKLIDIRDQEIQPQLFDKERPGRNPHIQRANFIYALIFKVKDEFRSPKDVWEFVINLEDKYPLAVPTIDEVKVMLKSLSINS